MKGKYLSYSRVPKVCKVCNNLDSDCADEYSPVFFYCTQNLIFPTKKQSCKKRRLFKSVEQMHNLREMNQQ